MTSLLLFFVFVIFKIVKNNVNQVPAMGDSITEGTVGEVVAPVGSYVQMDDVVAVLETDKVRDPTHQSTRAHTRTRRHGKYE